MVYYDLPVVVSVPGSGPVAVPLAPHVGTDCLCLWVFVGMEGSLVLSRRLFCHEGFAGRGG